MMLNKRVLLLVLSLAMSTHARAQAPNLNGYREVWVDHFQSLDLRRSGHQGSSMWSAPGAFSGDERGIPGFGGYDWFANPDHNWPSGYDGPFAIVPEGLRIRSQTPPRSFHGVLPLAHGRDRWLSGLLHTSDALLIAPPFYVEVQAKMPRSPGQPFPAIWLLTEASTIDRRARKPLNYEVDVQEGFGDDDRLHSTIHWTALDGSYRQMTVVDAKPGTSLTENFNTWGCLVSASEQTFFFNGREIGRAATPAGAASDQPFTVVLDVSAGLPWKGTPPFGGPFDMYVRYVRVLAPHDPIYR